ncbi:ABC transporter permease [Aquirufa aurantiipilula]|uniref:ABC transporter permease n=1 Tax=Aquirufa aurantiipilula TaxID=2696561 RepID=UPI001CAA74F1|nr:FtsX-like permease family protein [Aquirufa aurantiipilula]MBZ1325633.1 ABC transporter permease [Aquirufa aurantiipilula]
MWIVQLAWKNLWRNANRTMITMAAIFFAVLLSILMSSLKTGIFDNLIKDMVGYYSGYIQVHQAGYWEEQLLDNCFEENSEIQRKIRSHSQVREISPRLESFALASTGELSKGCLVLGINPVQEQSITHLSEKIVKGRYLSSNDLGILVSEGLLKRLKSYVGDTLVLFGQGYHGSTAAGKYPIQGVIQLGSPELNDKTIVMPLALTQDLYSATNMITSYVLSLQDTDDLMAIQSSLEKKLGKAYEVMTWQEMMPDIKQHIETDSANMKYVQAFLYLLISFGIFGTLLIMMAERRYELGMLVAIGMKKSKLSLLLLFESLFTVIVACILGILASIPVVYYLHKYPIRIYGEGAKAYERFGFEAVFPTSTDYHHFVNQGIAVLLIGLILSMYPVIKIIHLNPVDSMKK